MNNALKVVSAVAAGRRVAARLLWIAGLLIGGSSRPAAQEVFTHRIPIVVPKGANGMQPELALEYHPDTQNGVVGVGWRMTGLSAITRVNNGAGIRYAGADTYSDSSFGVLVPQPDGSYRSRRESFVRFVPSGRCGDGPCAWTAQYPSGIRYLYGDPLASSAASRVLAPNGASVRTWALSSVADLHGNSYEVRYLADPANGQLYPDLITYTKAANLATYRTVAFSYEDRPDTDPGYYQDAFQRTTRRLRWITVSADVTIANSGGTLIRRYRLDYDATGTTGRSRLVAVQEYGRDGSSTLPSQRFEWQQAARRIDRERWETGPAAWVGGTFLSGDFDGDGRTDLAYVFRDAAWRMYIDVHRSTGSQLVWERWESAQSGFPDGGQLLTGDFDGDGRTDIAFAFRDSARRMYIDVHRSTGTAMEWNRWESAQSGFPDGGRFFAGDFDGDGTSDLAFAFWNGPGNLILNIDVHRSTGASFNWERWETGAGLLPPDGTFLPGDYDGDGRTDLAYVHPTPLGAKLHVDVHRSVGTAMVSEPWAAVEPSPSGFPPAALETGDFDGDGKTDIAVASRDFSWNMYIDVLRSTGSVLLREQWESAQGGYPDTGRFHAGDFDGDGKSDLAFTWRDGAWNMYVDLHGSSGASLRSERWEAGQSGLPNDAAFFPGDYDGDGRSDLAFAFNDAGRISVDVHRSTDPFPDLVSTIHTGSGGRITLSYTPAPQLPRAIVPGTGWHHGIANTAPQQLVTAVTTADGRGGSVSAVFDYVNRRFLPGPMSLRRDLGFAWIEQTQAQTGLLTQTVFNQVPGYEGTVNSVSRLAPGGKLIHRTVYRYELAKPSTGTELPVQTRGDTQRFELGVPGPIVTTTTEYDAYGNPWRRSLATNLDEPLVTTVTYANDPARWVLGRVTAVAVTHGAATLRRLKNVWSNDAIAARSAWLDATGSWITTTYDHDANGNLVGITQPPAADGLTRRSTLTFDATYAAYPAVVTDAKGFATSTAFDANGGPTRVAGPNAADVTTISYDVFWRKQLEERPDGGTTATAYNSSGDASTQHVVTTRTVAGARPLVTKEWLDGSGFAYRVEETGSCPDGTTIVLRHKDAAGRPWKESQPFCGYGPPAFTTTEYDAVGRVHVVRTPDDQAWRYTYSDAAGTRTRIDPNQHATTAYQDALGRTTAVLDALNQRVDYSYDPLGALTGVSTPSGVTEIRYDSLGRRTSITAPDVGKTTYEHDAAGNLTRLSATDRLVTFEYDALNRVTSKRALTPAEAPVTYTYDEADYANSLGRLTTVRDAAGEAHYAYSAAGAVAFATRIVGGAVFISRFRYDQAGRLTRLEYPDGSNAEYAWDGATLARVALNGSPIAEWSSHDPAGRPKAVTYGNGVRTAYGYDRYGMGHLETLSTESGATRLQDLSYDWYTETGGINLHSITDNRRVRTCGSASCDETQTFAYDALDRLKRATGVWGLKEFDYDASGNPKVFGGAVARSLTFDGNRVVSGTGLSNVTYDGVGNMKTKTLDGVDWAYGWTADNRLAAVKRGGVQVLANAFDAHGERVVKTYLPASGPSVTTTYFGDLYERRVFGDGSPEQHTLYVYGNGQRLAAVTRAGTRILPWPGSPSHKLSPGEGTLPTPAPLSPAVLQAILGILLFGAGATWVVIHARRAVPFRCRARVGSRHRPVVRAIASGTLVAFTAAACSRGGAPATSASGLLAAASGPGLGVHYYHSNQVSSVTLVTDAYGDEVERVSYLPFGEVHAAASAGAAVVTRKFTGQESDPEAELIYYGARFYDPHIGRFLSADSVVPNAASLESFNRYSYVRNNPVSLEDPTGHVEDPGASAGLQAQAQDYGWMSAAGAVSGPVGFTVVAGYELWQYSQTAEFDWNKREFVRRWHKYTDKAGKPFKQSGDWVGAKSKQAYSWTTSELKQFGRWVGGLFGGGRHHRSSPPPASGNARAQPGGGTSANLPRPPPHGAVGEVSTPPGGGGSAPDTGSATWRFITPEEGHRIADEARQWSDTAYPPKTGPGSEHRGAGAVKGEFADCSGSTWGIYRDAGFRFGYLNSASFPSVPEFAPSPGNVPQIGDVGRWDGHLMIYDPTSAPGRNGWSASHPGGRGYGPAHSKWYEKEYGTPVTWYRFRVRVP